MDRKPLTFGQLDTTVENWVEATVEANKRFQNQSQEVTSWFKTVRYNEDQLKNINNWLNVLFYYDKCLNNDIVTISKYQDRLEQLVTKVEKMYAHRGDLYKVEPIRMEMFNSMSTVYLSICALTERVEEIVDKCKGIDKTVFKEPLDHISKLMLTDVNLLEEIENKLNRMNNCLMDVEYKKNCLIRKQMNMMDLIASRK